MPFTNTDAGVGVGVGVGLGVAVGLGVGVAVGLAVGVGVTVGVGLGPEVDVIDTLSSNVSAVRFPSPISENRTLVLLLFAVNT